MRSVVTLVGRTAVARGLVDRAETCRRSTAVAAVVVGTMGAVGTCFHVGTAPSALGHRAHQQACAGEGDEQDVEVDERSEGAGGFGGDAGHRSSPGGGRGAAQSALRIRPSAQCDMNSHLRHSVVEYIVYT